MSDILLITPPFTQLNTPYPATAYLKGFLNTKGIPAEQMDLGIEVILELFTERRLREVFARARTRVQGELSGNENSIVSSGKRQPLSDPPTPEITPNARRIFALREEYLATIEPVIAFLQGKQPTLARQIASENFLPQAGRFAQLEELDYAFGSMGHQDKAKHLATLYLEDLSDFIVECLDPDFGFSRYAEQIGRSANSFDALYAKLQTPLSFIDELTVELLDKRLKTEFSLAAASSPIEPRPSPIENPSLAAASSPIEPRPSPIENPSLAAASSPIEPRPSPIENPSLAAASSPIEPRPSPIENPSLAAASSPIEPRPSPIENPSLAAASSPIEPRPSPIENPSLAAASSPIEPRPSPIENPSLAAAQPPSQPSPQERAIENATRFEDKESTAPKTNLQYAVAQSRIETAAGSSEANHQSIIDNPTRSADESGLAPASADELAKSRIEPRQSPIANRLICLSVPFPGNLFSAFRCAQWLKANYPEVKIAMGGGFANTELRSVSDPRVFEFFDFITLDDGELPLELLYQHCLKPSTAPASAPLKRTFYREGGEVVYNDFSLQRDYRMHETGTPDYTGLPLDRYISVIEIANPMHSLWSDGRWNKLTMAHGCYWGKCTFCDVSLDYIGSYQPVQATLLVDRMEELIAQTGENGFHFVDEAAPPALMRDLALEIIRRQLRLTWWTNIRFEKSFTPDLCRLLQASGCIAVSGGLEVASDRLLALIQKGVTVEQVARVTGAFTDAGIMVHSYLMYGYPTQTVQETVDSLEMVRQLFEAGVIQSGFWHQFALTAHSPVGLDPEAYGIVPHYQKITFANNDVQFTDSTGIDHEQFSFGLKKSLFNYMHGLCFDFPLQEWFDFKIPRTQIAPDYIAACLDYEDDSLRRPSARLVWLGGEPEINQGPNGVAEITLYDRRDTDAFLLDNGNAEWLLDLLCRCRPNSDTKVTIGQASKDFEGRVNAGSFTDFWVCAEMELVRNYGLIVV